MLLNCGEYVRRVLVETGNSSIFDSKSCYGKARLWDN